MPAWFSTENTKVYAYHFAVPSEIAAKQPRGREVSVQISVSTNVESEIHPLNSKTQPDSGDLTTNLWGAVAIFTHQAKCVQHFF